MIAPLVQILFSVYISLVKQHIDTKMHNIETILNIKGNENACRALASRIQPILQENLTLQSEEFDTVVV